MLNINIFAQASLELPKFGRGFTSAPALAPKWVSLNRRKGRGGSDASSMQRCY
jgi:hypothetical protein